MKQFLASSIVNGNEIQLVKINNWYFIYWGSPDRPSSIKKLQTPSGRNPSPSSAHKQFVQAVKASQYLKFNKL